MIMVTNTATTPPNVIRGSATTYIPSGRAASDLDSWGVPVYRVGGRQYAFRFANALVDANINEMEIRVTIDVPTLSAGDTFNLAVYMNEVQLGSSTTQFNRRFIIEDITSGVEKVYTPTYSHVITTDTVVRFFIYGADSFEDISSFSVIFAVPGQNETQTEIIADIKTQLANTNWRLCDGSAFFDAESPIYNVNGRYLPNLIRDITLGGGDGVGAVTGGNILPDNKAHTHDFTPIKPTSNNIGEKTFKGGFFRILEQTTDNITGAPAIGPDVAAPITVDSTSLLAPVYRSTLTPGPAITTQGSDDVNIRNKTLQTFYIQKVK